MSIIKRLALAPTALLLTAGLTACGDSDMTAFLEAQEAKARTQPSWMAALSGSSQGNAAVTAPEGAVVLEKHIVPDPGTGGIDSHTLLTPAGWSKDLEIEWRPALQVGFVNLVGAVSDRNGQEARFHRMQTHTHFETNNRFNQPTARPGQLANGKVWQRPPSTAAAYATEVLLPQTRPGARNVQVVKTEEVESVARTWKKMFASELQREAQFNRMASGVQAKTHIAVPRVRVRYDENGSSYEEEFSFIFFGTFTSMSSMGTWFRGADWMVSDVKSVRAKQGELDNARPMLRTIVQSVRMTPKWHAMYAELVKYILDMRRRNHQITMQHMRKRSELIRKTNDDIMAMHRDSFNKQQASSDRLQRAWSNTMLGVDDYKLPDGTTRSLDSSYEHVYTNGSDQFIFTNDALFQPNVHSTQEWTRITPMNPTGSAAWR